MIRLWKREKRLQNDFPRKNAPICNSVSGSFTKEDC